MLIYDAMIQKIIKVLLIDDDTAYNTIVRQMLSTFQGYQFLVEWEPEGERVVERLQMNPDFDIILMDYYLPDKNGLEITKSLAEHKISIPTIFLTAHKDFRAAVEAIKFGAEDYLLKEDLRDTVLPRTIVGVLERSQLRKQVAEAEKQKVYLEKKSDAIKELVVTMCHEFNNPLAAIKISTAILTRQNLKTEEKHLLEKFNAKVALLEREITKLRDLNIDLSP